LKNHYQKFIGYGAYIVFALSSNIVFAAGPTTMVTPFSLQATIQPDTVFCVKGSDENQASYCADTTPCKTKVGATGASYQVCLAGTVNPPAGALILTTSCWNLKVDYTCMQYVSDCSNYTSNSKCAEVGSGICLTPTPSALAPAAGLRAGSCLSKSRRFSCIDAAAVTTAPTPIGCDSSSTLNGLDWSTHSDSAANDFIQATTSAEIARQLANYGDTSGATINGLFPGIPLGCRNKYGGLNNCCSESPSGTYTNRSVGLQTSLAISGFKMGAGYAMQFGSDYVKDFVMTKAAGTFAEKGAESMFSSISSTAGNWTNFTSSFGLYGFGFSASGAASGVGSTVGLYDATSSMALGESGIYFNPYAFAIAIGIQIVMDIMSCNQDEKDLANERKDNLCHYVGDFCSKELKALGVTIACLETTSNYCCYNGVLGKAIEEGAHSQLSLPWGSAKNPACGGLTPAQLSSLDFTTAEMKIALKPFQDQIMKSYKSNVEPMLSSGSVQTAIQSKNSTTAKSLCLQRKQFDSSTVCN